MRLKKRLFQVRTNTRSYFYGNLSQAAQGAFITSRREARVRVKIPSELWVFNIKKLILTHWTALTLVFQHQFWIFRFKLFWRLCEGSFVDNFAESFGNFLHSWLPPTNQLVQNSLIRMLKNVFQADQWFHFLRGEWRYLLFLLSISFLKNGFFPTIIFFES